MKLKFFLVLFLLIFSINNYSYSANRCNNFYQEINNSELDQELFLYPRYESTTIGFQLEVEWDQKADNNYGDWKTKFDKDGYPFIGKILFQDLMSKTSVGDKITKLNGEDIRKYTKKFDTDKAFTESLVDDENKFTIIDKEGKEYDLLTKKKDIEPVEIFYDIYFDHINIDDKTGSFDVALRKEFSAVLSDDFKLFQIAKKNLLYKYKDEFDFEECIFSVDDWRKLDVLQPDYGIRFKNIIIDNKSLQKENYFILPAFKEIDGLDPALNIFYNFEGTKKIRNNFNLKSFPFDRQKIKIYLFQNRYILDDNHTYPTDMTQREVEKYLAQPEPIQGWTIVDYKMNYKPDYDPNYATWTDGIEYVFTVDRNSGYYIYKVIFPIILILMICWSAVWIDPKEIESRLTITIVCLLSLIAYNFVIDSELPKLEYLTTMDYIILISYVYAAIPNFLSIYSFQLIKTNKQLAEKYENYEKRFGLASYIFIIAIIIMFNTNTFPENTNSMLSWFKLN